MPEKTLNLQEMVAEAETFGDFYRIAEEQMRIGGYNSLIPVMQMFLLNGKPYNLEKHFQFEYLFDTAKPKRFHTRAARQTGKTANHCGSDICESWISPYHRTMYVQPRFEQIKRLHRDQYAPFYRDSPFRDCLVDNTCDRSLLHRSYTNHSDVYFTYAFLNADATRGISGVHRLIIDEVQDILDDNINIIEEVTTAVEDLGIISYSGTPKTTDNPENKRWQRSSQGEWETKCDHCGKWNNGAADQHLLKMIGRHTVVCAFCGRPIECANGHYEHAFPERIPVLAGRHVSQIIHPIHYRNPLKWKDILYKMETYTEAQFYNEVLGVEKDSALKLINREQLKQACGLRFRPDNIGMVKQLLQQCSTTVLGIDWTGGGEQGDSYTALCLGGIAPGTDKIMIFWGEKFPKNMSADEEIERVVFRMKQFSPDLVAHDYGGAGYLRESMLKKQLGKHESKYRIVPYTYTISPAKPVVSFAPGSNGARTTYMLDKPRSLYTLCEFIKNGKVLFPPWPYISEIPSPGGSLTLLCDFEALTLEGASKTHRSDVVVVGKSIDLSDDFAHAVNYVCTTLWTVRGSYPDLASARQYRPSKEALAEADPVQAGYRSVKEYMKENPDSFVDENGNVRD